MQETTATFSNVDKPQKHTLSERSDTKDHLLHTSIYTKCLEKTKVEEKKAACLELTAGKRTHCE